MEATVERDRLPRPELTAQVDAIAGCHTSLLTGCGRVAWARQAS